LRHLVINDYLSIPFSEIAFRTSRSGGPGGQNVNKLESRVELLFDIDHSTVLSAEQKEKILAKLKNRVDSNGFLHIVSQASRSQWENKKHVLQEFVRLLRLSVEATKKRIATTPPRSTREFRLRKKKKLSAKKKQRRFEPIEQYYK
jgi:ribosome-associated protein